MTNLEQLAKLIYMADSESTGHTTEILEEDWEERETHFTYAHHIAQAILDAGWTAPEIEPITCSWCTNKARGSAWHNDGKLHPSCGQINHGSGWVPPQTPYLDN